MTEIPPLVAFLVVLGPPFAFGFLLGWWLRGRRATAAEAERQRLRQTELPSPKQIDYILSLAKRRGVKEVGDMPASVEAASAMIDALKAGDLEALAKVPRASREEVEKRLKG